MISILVREANPFIQHFAFCIQHFAFCIQHFAFCIQHFLRQTANCPLSMNGQGAVLVYARRFRISANSPVPDKSVPAAHRNGAVL